MKQKDLNVQVTPPNVQDEAATLLTASENVQGESASVQTETLGVQVEAPIVQDESANVQVATKTVQVTKSKKNEKKVRIPVKKDAAPPPPPPKKESTRKGITVMFSTGENSEYEHLSLIIKNRIEDGLSQNESHFVRQCIDYAINAQYFLERDIVPRFATHEEKMPWEYKLLKDALFASKKTDLRVCK